MSAKENQKPELDLFPMAMYSHEDDPNQGQEIGLTFGTAEALPSDAVRAQSMVMPSKTPVVANGAGASESVEPRVLVGNKAVPTGTAVQNGEPPVPVAGQPPQEGSDWRTDEVSPAILAALAAAGSKEGGSEDAQSTTNAAGEKVALPASQIGRYQLQYRLRRSGMANVYRAHDPSLGQDIAIRFLDASLSKNKEARARFLLEARIAGALSHPNIVAVHEVGVIDNRPYMAMELQEGASLAKRLDEKEPIPIRHIVLIGMQLAKALDHAHANGAVHRDIKPSNILLQPKDHGVKLADFGVAQTDDGSVRPYMSPEQARAEELDGRSDLFSLGSSLYQALTGERPFDGENLVALAKQITTAEPVSINSRRPDCPPSLRRVVERCMAKTPAQRYATGAELEEALRKVLAEIDAAEQEKLRPRVLPLPIKWTLTMAGLVAVVVGLMAGAMAQRHHNALVEQAREHGAALTRFMAAQNANAMLGDDWDTVAAMLKETARSGSFERISVIDMSGVVRASNLPDLVGKIHKTPLGERLETLPGKVVNNRYLSATGPVLSFEAPAMVGNQPVGRVALSLSEQPLSKAARDSTLLIIALALATLATLTLATYWALKRIVRPIKWVIGSMDELAKGHYEQRLDSRRNDEIGALCGACDALAIALQHRAEDEPANRSSPRASAPLAPKAAAMPDDAA
jgi:eukaryotic-like serine/threonine-protein kinase